MKLVGRTHAIEESCGVPAIMDMQPMQAGDVYATYADIDPASQDLGYAPSTPIEVGIPKFVEWYKRYHGM